MSKKLISGVCLFAVAGLLLAACGGAATATPQVVEVTRVVAGTPVVEQVEVAVTTTPVPTPEPGSVEFQDKPFRIGIFSDLTSVNYWVANGPDNTVWNAYVLQPSRLTLFTSSDQKFQLIPQAAADFATPLEQEGDMWVSTVTLKDGIKWSDGEPYTANDVAFTANTALRFGLIAGNWSAWYDGAFLDHVEAVDATHAKFVYHTKPGLARHEYGALQGPILAEHFWKDKVDAAAAPLEGMTKPGADATDDEKAAYSTAETAAQEALYAIDASGEPLAGAYLFAKWETGAFAENDYNPDYYFSGATITEYQNGAYHEEKAGVYDFTAYGEATGEPTLFYTVGPFMNAAVYSIYSDQNAAVLALKNGEIDFMLNSLGLQRGLLGQVQDDPNLTVIQNNTNGFRYMTFNTRRAPMNDVAFRQAVAVLIDKEFVTGTILQGVAFPLYTYVPKGNGAWYFDEVPKFGLKDDGTPMTREERINEAVRILKDAGYTWTGGVEPVWDPDNQAVTPGGRLILPDGTPIKDLGLLAPSAGYDPLRSTFAIWIETWLNEAGIPVTANLTGFNVIVQKMFSEQDFDLSILGWSLSIFPSYLRDFFHTDQAVLDGNNAGGYSSPQFDELSDQLLTCDTQESCKQISDQIQLLLATETPYVLLFDTGIIEAYRSASVQFPYSDSLSGLQFLFSNGLNGANAFSAK
jgi:ABC-type transport system substrate-binding protein